MMSASRLFLLLVAFAAADDCTLDTSQQWDLSTALNILTGTTVDVTLDSVMGGTSTATVDVVLDNVMGGTSSGTVSEGSSLDFEGYCDLTSGGFAQLYLGLPETINILDYDGFMLEVDTLAPDLNRAAPLSFSFEFYSGDTYTACTAHSSFGIPIAEPLDDGTQPKVSVFVSIDDFRAKGPFYVYFGGPVDSEDDFLNGFCGYASLPAFKARRTSKVILSIVYEEGPFDLNLHSILAVPKGSSPAATCSSCTGPLPDVALSSFGVEDNAALISSAAGASAFLTRSLDRAAGNIAKGEPGSFAGVGTMEMYSLALSVVGQAARQVAATDGLHCPTRQSLLAAAEQADAARFTATRPEMYFAQSKEPLGLVDVYAALEESVLAAISALA